jgi:outer membrane protein
MSGIRRFSVHMAAGLALAGLSVFGAPAVQAQTPAATPPGPERRLSITDAVELALKQNADLEVVRITPLIQDENIAQARSAWAPTFTTFVRGDNRDTPINSLLAGDVDKLENNSAAMNFGLSSGLPWRGASYRIGWDNSRATTNNIFANFTPQTASNLTFNFTQPLLRNFGIDNTRQQLQVSRKNREISEVQVTEAVATTTRRVKNTYWDLVFALNSLEVQRLSLDLAQRSLKENRARVEIGTMAPIDIVQAEAEVASNEENVIIGEQTVAQAQDQLRALVLEPTTPDFWNTTFETTDAPSLATTPVDVDAAVAKAMAGRLDLQQARKQLESNDIRLKYFQNQTLPDISAAVNYGLAGLGGTVLTRDGSGLNPGDVTSTTQIPYSEVLRDVFGFAFPTWSVGVNVSYPIGRNGARVNVERQRLTNEQNLLQLRDLERQVVQQVRDLARQVNTNLKRVATTQAARALAERRLEAEQKKFGVGLSTTFNVLQAQRDLAEARNNEQRAILDFEKSRVDFEAAQEASISGAGAGSLTLGGAIGQGTGSTGSTTGVTQGAGRVGQNR